MDDEEFLATLKEGLLGEDPAPEIELPVAANVLGTVWGTGDVRVLQVANDDDFLHEGAIPARFCAAADRLVDDEADGEVGANYFYQTD